MMEVYLWQLGLFAYISLMIVLCYWFHYTKSPSYGGFIDDYKVPLYCIVLINILAITISIFSFCEIK